MRVHINIYDPRCVWGRRDTVGRTIPDFLFLFCQPSETRGEGSGFALYFFVIFGLISEQLLTARRRSSRPIFGAGYADRRSGCDDGKSSYAENRLDARLGAYLAPGASLFRLHRLILSGKVNGIQRFEGSSIEISSSFFNNTLRYAALRGTSSLMQPRTEPSKLLCGQKRYKRLVVQRILQFTDDARHPAGLRAVTFPKTESTRLAPR